MKDRIVIELPADLKYLRMVSLIVAKAAQSTFPHDSLDNFEDSDVFIHACELAVSEAFCNAVKHCENPSRSSCVKIKFEIEEKKLKVTIKDQNPEFDFDAVSPAGIETYPDSGHGIFLMKQVMDEVSYGRDGEWNVVMMSKNHE